MVGIGSCIVAAGASAAVAATVVACCTATPIPEEELALLGEQRLQSQASAERRRLRAVAGHWLAQHRQPRTIDHPFVFRLFAEMGDFPLGREYYTIAYRRLARWFREHDDIDAVIDEIVEETVLGDPVNRRRPAERIVQGAGEPPDEEAPLLDERPDPLEEERVRVKAELRDFHYRNPLEFCTRYREHIPHVLRPPEHMIYRISSQIIEAAIALRVRDLEDTQNVVASEVVQRAADRTTSFSQRLWLLRAGVIPWYGIFGQSSQPARPDQ